MKKRILMVNNDPPIREAMCSLLQSEGHLVFLTATGRDGIREFCARHFDLLILDVNLPDTSGWNIFKTLTSVNPFLPIVVTGRNDQRELAVFEGQLFLADVLDVPKLMQAVAEESRQTVGDASPMTSHPAQRLRPCAAATVDMHRIN